MTSHVVLLKLIINFLDIPHNFFQTIYELAFLLNFLYINFFFTLNELIFCNFQSGLIKLPKLFLLNFFVIFLFDPLISRE